MSREELDKAYNDFKKAIKNHVEQDLELLIEKQQLKSEEARHRIEGLDGSNEKTREANLQIILQKRHDAVTRASAFLKERFADVEIAKLEVRRIEWIIRLLELNTHTT